MNNKITIDDLTILLLIEWNRKTIEESYEKSFDFYVKTEFPRSYKSIIDEVKYNEWENK